MYLVINMTTLLIIYAYILDYRQDKKQFLDDLKAGLVICVAIITPLIYGYIQLSFYDLMYLVLSIGVLLLTVFTVKCIIQGTKR